ncbi:MAG: branched-chain amino acid ABC transporter permease [Actinobacteria bacterium]|nr:branched-chain amino acid ABC transporter permease [Actinomycetota bacterium]
MSGRQLRVERQTRASRVGVPAAIIILAIAVSLPLWGSSNLMKTGVTFLTLVALAQMWNLLAGYAGLLSVGQQAFVGIGAYGVWALAEKGGVHPFVAVPIAGLIAAAFALPTAGLTFRLRGGYFAVGTWVVAEVFRLLVINIAWLGGGSGGSITSVGRIARDTREAAVYWLALGVAVGAVVLVYLILRSKGGLALASIRDDQTAAAGLGVNTVRSKLWVYVLSAFGCGTTGAVIYLNLLTVQPEGAFSLNWSALMIFTVVIGGVGTIEGPILGALIFFGLQQVLSDYGSWYLVLIGTIAATSAVFAKQGLWGILNRRWTLELFPVRRRVDLDSDADPPATEPDAQPTDRPKGSASAPSEDG